ncbi:hypothetical protein F2Q70_00041003 [Brassica cretica]|uniref:UBA domain-containing protein n=1 Tax=Brassica cretica TaxID=69181 RepID=A0A8S9K2I8_BRACR|nr:hypothetical protein F2Q70_00041003 [Brassica cretica]
MNGGPSGFHNAPVTKAFVITSALFTVLFGIQGRSSKLGLSYQFVSIHLFNLGIVPSTFMSVYSSNSSFQVFEEFDSLQSDHLFVYASDLASEKMCDSSFQDIFEKFRIWKLIMSSFAFSSTPESMFGLYLLYYFRVFERQIGSNKYSVFILFSGTLSLLLEVTLLSLLKGTLHSVSRQPKSASLLVRICNNSGYHRKFTDLWTIRPDICFVYTLLLGHPSFNKLLLSSWKRSIFPGVCGIIAGSLYRLNILGIRKAKFPEFAASFFSRLSLPSFSSSSSPAPSRNIVGTISPNTRSQPAPMASSVEPSEEAIATLVSMGFDRNAARQALVHARNDVNAATNILLEAQSH